MASKKPTYRHHKHSGQATVRIDGREIYLGKFGSDESREKYYRILNEWKAGHPVGPPRRPRRKDVPTVGELVALFTRKRVEPYYVRDGRPTGEATTFAHALAPLVKLYGSTPVNKFGPRELKAVREEMIERGNARTTINRQVGRIRQMFRWGVAEEMYSPTALVALEAVEGLARGRAVVRESVPVGPIDAATVAKTLPELSQRVAAIVRLIQLTGARPGEICKIRPADIDRSGPVWDYRPVGHKTEHHGRGRVVLIGPAAQDILRPWLERTADRHSHCFRPADAKSEGAWRGGRPILVGKPYSVAVLRVAIARACDRLEIPAWHPNQLRHAAATAIRKRFDLEAARVVLGHSKANVTEVYAERDLTRAREVMGEIG